MPRLLVEGAAQRETEVAKDRVDAFGQPCLSASASSNDCHGAQAEGDGRAMCQRVATLDLERVAESVAKVEACAAHLTRTGRDRRSPA